MKADKIYDLIIIGGGPAGMTAALYAARARLDVLVIESNITGGLVNSTFIVENYPGTPQVHGMELMQKLRDQLDALEINIEEANPVLSLDLHSKPKRIVCEDGDFFSQTLILATGRRPIPLDLPTEIQELHHCAICDGAAYAGKDVVVVGGGNSAFDESLFLLNCGIRHIHLVESMPRCFAAQATQDKLLSSGKTTLYLNTTVNDGILGPDKKLQAVRLASAKGEFDLSASALFVFLGQQPNNTLFKDMLPLDEHGYIVANQDMNLAIPGVYSAGDINAKTFRQITTAVADGTIAALSAEKWLRSH